MFIDDQGRVLRQNGGEVVVENVRFNLELTNGRGLRRGHWQGYADLPRGSHKRLNALEVYRIELEDGTWGLVRFSSLMSDQGVRVVGKGALHFPG